MIRKLTLSMEEKDIRDARRLAKEQGTSVSAMFARFVRALAAKRRRKSEPQSPLENDLPPLTRKALGMVSAPEGKTDRELLEEALLEKYGLDK